MCSNVLPADPRLRVTVVQTAAAPQLPNASPTCKDIEHRCKSQGQLECSQENLIDLSCHSGSVSKVDEHSLLEYKPPDFYDDRDKNTKRIKNMFRTKAGDDADKRSIASQLLHKDEEKKAAIPLA